jgi:hypothetical protein
LFLVLSLILLLLPLKFVGVGGTFLSPIALLRL